MRIAVGSTNLVKIKAARNVFRRFFTRVHVEGVDVGAELPPQPIGKSKIIACAIRRAKRALTSGKFDLGVGIEAGLVRAPRTISGFVDVQWCAIVDRRGVITLGHGPGFEYPAKLVKEVLSKGTEVGWVMERITGIKRIGERMGAVGYLSRGRLDRIRLTEQAVLVAMIPRLSPKLYSLSKRGASA